MGYVSFCVSPTNEVVLGNQRSTFGSQLGRTVARESNLKHAIRIVVHNNDEAVRVTGRWGNCDGGTHSIHARVLGIDRSTSLNACIAG